jgi:two-component system NarL family response regulator
MNETTEQPQQISILIADDHPIFRVGLRNLLDAQPDMKVVAEAADGATAIKAHAAHHPDVTLMDLRMPALDGTAAISAVRAADPRARIIVLTTYDGDEDVERAVRAGAQGYLLKDTFAEGLLDAIRDVAAGESLLDEQMAARGREGQPVLSPREVSILALVARGLSNKEIQAALSMAEGTLRNHLKRIFVKLEVNDRTQASMVAVKRGLIRMP